jgi:hypothetical protein
MRRESYGGGGSLEAQTSAATVAAWRPGQRDLLRRGEDSGGELLPVQRGGFSPER